MKTNRLISFSVDEQSKTINIERVFSSPLPKVWASWTECQLLDQWWAPNPWRVETQKMSFKPGGTWLYAMIGPKGEKQWSRLDFESVGDLNSFSGKEAFTDENGDVNHSLPQSFWTVQFTPYGESTLVTIDIEYENLSDLQTSIQMGFQEGFTAAMENLDGFLLDQV